MRKMIFTLFLALVASVGTLFAQSGSCGDNLKWDLTDGVLTISGTGAMNDFPYSSKIPWDSYSSSIESVILKDGVTSIGVMAFYKCSSLTAITIPNSVTSIGKDAFYKCSSLTAITIPNSVTSIGKNAFSGCIALTSMTIPNSVTSIGDGAFSLVLNIVYNGTATGSPWGAKSVNGFVDGLLVYSDETKTNLLACSAAATGDISIPNSVTSIKQSAFSNCSSLTSVTIPNSVTSIGYRTFYGCGLTYMIIPNSVTSIGMEAFEDCSKLTSVTIPNSVTSIEGSAFSGCGKLTSVYISDLTAWCNISFSSAAFYNAYNLYLNGKLVTDLVIPSSITSIKESTFCRCSSLRSVTIPNNVTSIGPRAFWICSGLTSVTIPNSVTSIGNQAFELCSSLTSVTIPNSVTKIESQVFHSCSSLSSVEIPNSVTSIGDRAFVACYSLTSLNIPNSVTNIGDYAFGSCTGLTTVNIPNSVKSINEGTFSGCSSLSSVTIPNSVTSFGFGAFEDCRKLTSIEIPNSVTSIGQKAFYGCKGLTSVTIPNSVTSIGYEAFSDCTALTSVHISDLAAWCKITFGWPYDKTYDTNLYQANPLYYAHKLYLNGELVTDLVIPNSVTNIKACVFYGCSSLLSMTIPYSVTSIGDEAFRNCTSLVSIYMESSTPPSLSAYTFGDISSDAVIYVPFGSVGVYKSSYWWKNMNILCLNTISYNYNKMPTGAVIRFDVEGVNLQSCGMEDGETFEGNVLEITNLDPETEYIDKHIALTSNTGETEIVNVSFTTTVLSLTTQQSKPVSSNTAILLAETNMADIETSCGFEWKRTNAPDDMQGTKVFCPVANGLMAGRLKGLKDDVYYKYRAFYESKSGNMYYGDWQYIFTGDVTVEFEPVLYTYAAAAVKENEATLKGYALAGSEDFTEQGFEYWAESRANKAPRHTATIGEHHTVTASGISMTTTLTDLDAGTVYRYRTYAKTGDQILYGTEMTFTTQGEYQEGQAIEGIHTDDSQATKFLHEGQIYILRGNNTYDIQGKKVK